MRTFGGHEIAIVGTAGRFPGAADVRRLWTNLRQGVCTIRRIRSDAAMPLEEGHVPFTGALDDVELFDPDCFGMSVREAEILDVQQRLFLEWVSEVLDASAQNPKGRDMPVGVFAGSAMSSYLFGVLERRDVVRALGELAIRQANDKDFLTTRASYKFDFGGPSVAIQTSCSTGLVAVHLACQSLLAGECDLAIAGAVSIRVPQEAGYYFEPQGILSPDGMCRPFAADASGTIFTNGGGVVALKRLADALHARDPVRAVILGTAINNDGAQKVGFTAPSVDGQARALAEALAVADVDPASVTCIEGHGTGTRLGDPIELAAIRKVYGVAGAPPCAIGSIKANIGHLGTAAGIAGIVKAVLMLQHGEIVPTLHCADINPELHLEGSRFFISTRVTPFQSAGPRRVGVSSFGMGGTNAHAILEEAPPRPRRALRPRPRLVLVSAGDATGVDRAAANLAERLELETPELADVAFTTQVAARHYAWRRAVVARGPSDAAARLRAMDTRLPTRRAEVEPRRPVFLFPDQGARACGTGAALYRGIPAFRAAFDECADTVAAHLPVDLRATLGFSGKSPERCDIHDTANAQPALFAVEYALARTLVSLGVVPGAVGGHGVGEVAAAVVAGILPLADAARLIAARSRLMHDAPAGAMVAVATSASETEALLGDGLSIAAINAPDATTVSGPTPAIQRLETDLAARAIPFRRLRTPHAFASDAFDDVADRLTSAIAGMTLRPPSIPFVSTLTGTWLSDTEAPAPGYWGSQLRRPVQFLPCVRELLRAGYTRFLEVGPGSTLIGFVRSTASGSGTLPETAPVLGRAGENEAESLLSVLGTLWSAGAQVAWSDLYPDEDLDRVELPPYPFRRRACWIGPAGPVAPAAAPGLAGDAREVPALGLVESLAPAAGEVGDRPPTPVEELLLDIWRELLGADGIGVHTSFFDLGGNSLVAVRMVSRLREVFQVELSLRQLVTASTVADLAQVITDHLTQPQ